MVNTPLIRVRVLCSQNFTELYNPVQLLSLKRELGVFELIK
jgi:hypothetical protein